MTSTAHRQRLAAADRAQVVQIAAILLFGIAILAFAAYQATVVPQQNARVEFQHSQTVETGLEHARAGVHQTARTGPPQPVTFPLGTRYPDRFLAVNPPPAAGRIATSPARNATVSNAITVGGLSLGLGDGQAYPTRALTYRPSYNAYSAEPRYRFGASVLYTNYTRQGGIVLASGQSLVRGSDIRLTTLRGRLGRTGTGATTLEVRPVSAPAQPVTVRSTLPDRLTVKVPTQLPEKHWAALLEDQMAANGGNVSSADCSGSVGPSELSRDTNTPCGTLTLTFVEGTYDLHLSAVGVGTVPGSVDSPYTLVAVGGNTTYVGEETRHQLVVEVRDRYNNPVSGVTVNASVASGSGTIVVNNSVTGEDGRATIVYEAPAVSGSQDNATEVVEVAFGGELHGGDTLTSQFASPKDVRFEVWIQNTDAGGGGGPASPLTIQSAEVEEPQSGNQKNGAGLLVGLRNQNQTDATVTAVAVSHGNSRSIVERRTGTGPWNREVHVDSSAGPGYYEAGDDQTTSGPLTDGSRIDLQDTALVDKNADVYFYAFRDTAGQEVNLNGDTVTIRVFYTFGGDEYVAESTVTL